MNGEPSADDPLGVLPKIFGVGRVLDEASVVEEQRSAARHGFIDPCDALAEFVLDRHDSVPRVRLCVL